MKNLEHNMDKDVSEALDVLRVDVCGIFCCVIEEEELQLHFVKLGFGCF